MACDLTFEVTDLFGGDPNYSWVNRGSISFEGSDSQMSVVRRIKKELGWTGQRCRVENWGDTLAIYPTNMAQVCFVNFS